MPEKMKFTIKGFKIEFDTIPAKFGMDTQITLVATYGGFKLRKAYQFINNYINGFENLIKNRLLYWFINNVHWYYKTSLWEKAILFSCKRKEINGAIIKEFHNKIYILEVDGEDKPWFHLSDNRQ